VAIIWPLAACTRPGCDPVRTGALGRIDTKSIGSMQSPDNSRIMKDLQKEQESAYESPALTVGLQALRAACRRPQRECSRCCAGDRRFHLGTATHGDH